MSPRNSPGRADGVVVPTAPDRSHPAGAARELSPLSFRIGATELTLVPDGEMLRPSGEGVYGTGAADGWGEYTPPDARGDVAMMPHSLLVRGPSGTVLVDTGGEIPDEIPDRRSDFLEQLAGLGVRPEDVGAVILTHAHLDHIGYNTRRLGAEWIPTFPKATYFIQGAEASAFRAEDPARWERYFAPLEEAGSLRRLAGDLETAPGITCLATPGHTPGHQSVLIECNPEGRAFAAPKWLRPRRRVRQPSGRRGPSGSAIYLGDLAVTKLHLEHLDWHPAWCRSPADERVSKERIIALALERGAVLVFGHDPHVPWGRLERLPATRSGESTGKDAGVRVVPLA